MLYKNKKNILKSAVALMLMLTLSLSTALSPLAKAEEAKYTWKTVTSMPVSNLNDLRGSYISPDGSKLFIAGVDAAHNTNLWMSADDGATWRKIFSKPTAIKSIRTSADGSKIVLGSIGASTFYISTDGGQSWTESQNNGVVSPTISPDGSFLVGCSGGSGAYITHISTDDGQTWTQKGTNSIECPTYVTNNGTLIAQSSGDMAKSTDYGQTWTETPGVLNGNSIPSFSNNGNNVFDGDRISLDGGNHWTSINAPIPTNNGGVCRTAISDDGKKLFIEARNYVGAELVITFLVSVDGGRTWHVESAPEHEAAVSSDGSKLFSVQFDGHTVFYRVGTLPAAQPVTPGSGAGGTATPSASTSAALNQKPGKASGRLAETGTSTWMVGGLAAVAVAAGALVLRKRL